MFTKTPLIAAAAAVGTTMVSARIEGFYLPTTVQAGHKANVLLASHGYSQTVLDVSAAWGVGQDLYQGTLGDNVQDLYFLGPDQSNQGNANVTQQISIPENLTTGTQLQVALALTSVYGASGSPIVGYNVGTVTVGEATSEEYTYVEGLPSTC